VRNSYQIIFKTPLHIYWNTKKRIILKVCHWCVRGCWGLEWTGPRWITEMNSSESFIKDVNFLDQARHTRTHIFYVSLLLECTKKGLYGKISCLTFWHHRCFWEDSTCHVPNVVRLPDTPVLYLIGEFSYPVWNTATNEQSSDRPRDWWPGQVAASISSNVSHFFSKILQSPPEPLNFIYFRYIALDILSRNCYFTQLECLWKFKARSIHVRLHYVRKFSPRSLYFQSMTKTSWIIRRRKGINSSYRQNSELIYVRTGGIFFYLSAMKF